MRFVVLAVLALGLACGEEVEPRPPPPPGTTGGMVGRTAGPGGSMDAGPPVDAATTGDARGVVDAFPQTGDGAVSCANQEPCPPGLTCCRTTTICVIDPMTCPL